MYNYSITIYEWQNFNVYVVLYWEVLGTKKDSQKERISTEIMKQVARRKYEAQEEYSEGMSTETSRKRSIITWWHWQ